MSLADRVLHPALLERVMSADQAAALIHAGANVGMSGFTGAGYPKAVPMALARRIEEQNAQGKPFKIGLWTGASTAPELDGALAKVGGIEMRMPYQSDPACRERINAGTMQYMDIHLSHMAQFVWFGLLGHLDVALVEVAGVLPDGRLIPSSSIGNNKTWLEQADKIILEVNDLQSLALEGMHDIYYGTDRPPHRKPIPLTEPNERIGEPYLRCDMDKVIAVVHTSQSDRNSRFAAPDAVSSQIAGHIIEFMQHEVKLGRLPADLLPLQSGVGNIANAVCAQRLLPVVLHDAPGGQGRRHLMHRAHGLARGPHRARRAGHVTEQGLAGLRGHSPTQRAKLTIDNCAHPAFRPALPCPALHETTWPVPWPAPADTTRCTCWTRRSAGTRDLCADRNGARLTRVA